VSEAAINQLNVLKSVLSPTVFLSRSVSDRRTHLHFEQHPLITVSVWPARFNWPSKTTPRLVQV